MTFVVATKKLENLQQWVYVSDVFENDSDAKILERAGVDKISDPNYLKYSQRLEASRSSKIYLPDGRP